MIQQIILQVIHQIRKLTLVKEEADLLIAKWDKNRNFHQFNFQKLNKKDWKSKERYWKTRYVNMKKNKVSSVLINSKEEKLL